MKFKFRADEKDIKIFVGFCILLLYFCCIAVLNARSLATTGTLYGFLPFEAFTPEYLGTTLFLFILILLGVCFSVSSYFFEREKGVGITTQKKDKGYSRWCSNKEMKKTLHEIDPSANKLDHAGIAIISDGKKMWVDDGEAHNLVIGSTGSGKTQTVVLPQIKLAMYTGESLIIKDNNGEIYERTAKHL